jgi:hypothetical protein
MSLTPIMRLAVLAVIVCAFGCSSNNKGKIEGTKWSSLQDTFKGKQIAAGTLTLEFSKDGKVVYKCIPGTFTGTYKLGSGNNVTITLDQPLAGRKTHTQKVAIDGDRMTMADPTLDGITMTFQRID